jgi:hypothetical protein
MRLAVTLRARSRTSGHRLRVSETVSMRHCRQKWELAEKDLPVHHHLRGCHHHLKSMFRITTKKDGLLKHLIHPFQPARRKNPSPPSQNQVRGCILLMSPALDVGDGTPPYTEAILSCCRIGIHFILRMSLKNAAALQFWHLHKQPFPPQLSTDHTHPA